MTRAEALKRLADVTKQLDDAKSKLAAMEEVEMHTHLHWLISLEGMSAKDMLKERDELKERLAGNMQGIGHISDQVRTLRQVADAVWKNVDPQDHSTHPANNVAETKLIKLGWSPSLSKAGASIVRPDWAAKGRKAEE